MKNSHIRACTGIVAVSEPWKTFHERIEFDLYLSRKEAYVCMAGSRAAGFIIFASGPVFARGGYIRAVGVAPDFRRQGIGRYLLKFAEKKIAKKCSNVYLCVSSFNRRAQAFYKNAGYRKVGKIPDLILQDASEYIYWKRLLKENLPQSLEGAEEKQNLSRNFFVP